MANLTSRVLTALDASTDPDAANLAAWVRRTWGARLPVTVARLNHRAVTAPGTCNH